jgi:hypothetical protein
VALVEKLGFLRLPFTGKPRPDEDERLMQLFKNRAGLKKAHATLQDQLYDLKDRLKQEEANTAKGREHIDALEALLGAPESGFSALVYFQLRGLWRACNLQLATFASELERQQDERERRKHSFEFNQSRRQRLEEVDARLAGAEHALEEQQHSAKAVDDKLARLRGFWNYFKRRRVLQERDRERGLVAEAQQRCEDIRAEHVKVEAEEPPPFEGLSVEGKRAINLATLAYALVLSVKLATQGLTSRIKDAMTKRVHESSYGTREDCEVLMTAIAQALVAVKSRKELASEIKGSVDAMRAAAQYRSPGDTIPLAESLAAVVPPNPSGRAMLAVSAPEILADDYWNVYGVLLR